MTRSVTREGGGSNSLLEVNRFEEVTQIKLSREDGGRPVYRTAAYLVDGLLVDTGCSYTAGELLRLLEDLGARPGASSPRGAGGGRLLRLVVNTHHHEDHVGANRRLQERFGVDVFAHPTAVSAIASRPELQRYREIVWGYPEPSRVLPLANTVRTERHTFNVVDTPGHCDGHVTLVEPERGWCFSGDLYVGRHPKAIRPDEDVAATVRSMERLAAVGGGGDPDGHGPVPALTLFTGTGKVVEDGGRALLECAAYLRDLHRQVKEFDARGVPAPAIRDQLLGGESVLALLTDGHYSAENLVRGLLAASL